MKLASLAALLGVATAANPVNESTNTVGWRCTYGYLRKYTGAHSHCGYQTVNSCCFSGFKQQYYWKNLATCNQMGGHFCKSRVKQCSAKIKSYVWQKRRFCKKNANMKWKRMPGAAWNVAHNRGKIWVIGTNVEGGGYGIYRWDKNHWTKIPGSAIRAAVDKYQRGWVVNKAAYIYGYINNRWVMASGRAWDIDVGTENKLWVIGTNAEGGGFGIYRWDGRWTKVPGSAVRLSVDGQGNAWVVNKFRRIYRFWGGKWYLLNGLAYDVASYDGNVAVRGTDNAIWRRWHLGNTWDQTNARGCNSIAMGPWSRAACSTTGAQIWLGW